MINLADYTEINKNRIPIYWGLKIPVYAFVFRGNQYVNKGIYNLRGIPAIWRTAIFDLLTSSEVEYMVKKEEVIGCSDLC